MGDEHSQHQQGAYEDEYHAYGLAAFGIDGLSALPRLSGLALLGSLGARIGAVDPGVLGAGLLGPGVAVLEGLELVVAVVLRSLIFGRFGSGILGRFGLGSFVCRGFSLRSLINGGFRSRLFFGRGSFECGAGLKSLVALGGGSVNVVVLGVGSVEDLLGGGLEAAFTGSSGVTAEPAAASWALSCSLSCSMAAMEALTASLTSWAPLETGWAAGLAAGAAGW